MSSSLKDKRRSRRRRRRGRIIRRRPLKIKLDGKQEERSEERLKTKIEGRSKKSEHGIGILFSSLRFFDFLQSIVLHSLGIKLKLPIFLIGKRM
jgi:hypothetical protein